MNSVALFEVRCPATLGQIRDELRKRGFPRAARAMPPDIKILWSADANDAVPLPFPSDEARIPSGVFLVIDLSLKAAA
ncbi:MAG TPA: hypothetical protein VF438_00810 [Candidatus Paceibacterota bacterium]